MLKIEIKGMEFWDNNREEFVQIPNTILYLEHSLKAISEWESKYEKSFLSTCEKGLTVAETKDYIKFMNVGDTEITDDDLIGLTQKQLDELQAYMDKPMTATTFQDRRQYGLHAGRKKEIITAEIVYYWMIEAGIPLECDKWNFNKLTALIRVFAIKNNGNNKMSKRETMEFNKALMAKRRAEHGKH